MRNWLLAALLASAAAIAIYFGLASRSIPQKSTDAAALQTETSPALNTAPALRPNAESVLSPVVTNVEAGPIVVTPVASPGSPPPSGQSAGEQVDLPPATVLENMRTVIRQYGSMFGGNPVGTNPEITKALQGDNPKQINFLKPDGNRVSGNGELIDPWGTPYFFHQLSGAETEIRSAGPDKIMWTADDVVIK